MSDGSFTLYQQLGSYSWQKQVWTYLRQEHVGTCSVLGDLIFEMKRVTESGQQEVKREIMFALLQALVI